MSKERDDKDAMKPTPGAGTVPDGTPPPTDPPATPPGAGSPPSDPPEGGTTPRRTLQYSEPEEMGDGNVRLRASDGRGNALTVTAADRAKAQAALRAGFRALHGDDTE